MKTKCLRCNRDLFITSVCTCQGDNLFKNSGTRSSNRRRKRCVYCNRIMVSHSKNPYCSFYKCYAKGKAEEDKTKNLCKGVNKKYERT